MGCERRERRERRGDGQGSGDPSGDRSSDPQQLEQSMYQKNLVNNPASFRPEDGVASFWRLTSDCSDRITW
jgi:hypothetical protein